MKIEDLRRISNEEERVAALYEIFDEDSRLSSKATRVEFFTTVRHIEKHLKPGMKILDLERVLENIVYTLRKKAMM